MTTTLTLLRRCLPSLLALLGSLCVVGAAQASSLVYISNNNVWLANPDGSGQYEVTSDGTAADPYQEASQANDGTIVAVHGKGENAQIVRMAQNGTLLNPPFGTAVPDTGPLNAVVSPDGTKVAYWGVVAYSGCFDLCLGIGRTYQVSYADHYVNPSTFNPSVDGWSSFGSPAWMGNGRNLLFTNSGTVWLYDLGSPESNTEPLQWFQDDPNYSSNAAATGNATWDGWTPGNCCSVTFEQGAVSEDGTRMAIVIANSYVDKYEIAIFSAAGDLANGNPPADPILSRCLIPPLDGTNGAIGGTYPDPGPLFGTVSWSPDDSGFAFDYNGAIYVAQVTSLSNCMADPIYKVIANGSDPSWGPANVNPGPRQPPCTVPRLGHDSLSAARRALSASHCTTGLLTRAKHPRHKPPRHHRWVLVVTAQSPAPGSVEPFGTAVNLQLAYVAVRK